MTTIIDEILSLNDKEFNKDNFDKKYMRGLKVATDKSNWVLYMLTVENKSKLVIKTDNSHVFSYPLGSNEAEVLWNVHPKENKVELNKVLSIAGAKNRLDNRMEKPVITEEHEYKFLAKNDKWRGEDIIESNKLSQIYLIKDENKWQTRIRIIDDKEAKLTVKGPRKGITNPEFEFNIPVNDAHQLFMLSNGDQLTKIRHTIKAEKGVWEVDEFLGDKLDGLVLIELEVSSTDYKFTKPDWVGEDVTLESKYRNDSLAEFNTEKKKAKFKI